MLAMAPIDRKRRWCAAVVVALAPLLAAASCRDDPANGGMPTSVLGGQGGAAGSSMAEPDAQGGATMTADADADSPDAEACVRLSSCSPSDPPGNPLCPPPSGCCHDPCIDGEQCSAGWHNTGWWSNSCVCHGGVLECCVTDPLGNHLCDAEKCVADGGVPDCANCCANAYSHGGGISNLLESHHDCYCAPSACGDVCGGDAGICGLTGPFGSGWDSACAECIRSHVGVCGGSDLVTGCWDKCP